MYVTFWIFCFIVLLCVLLVWMCTVLLPPGVNPIAGNKYNNNNNNNNNNTVLLQQPYGQMQR